MAVFILNVSIIFNWYRILNFVMNVSSTILFSFFSRVSECCCSKNEHLSCAKWTVPHYWTDDVFHYSPGGSSPPFSSLTDPPG